MNQHTRPVASGIRRRSLLGAAALAVPALRPAWAQGEPPAWPVRQTRLVIPFTAGSVLDIPARFLSDRLSRRLRATVIVENKPGAGGGLGTMEVVRSAPDGASLLVASNSISILPFLQPRLGLDPVRDLVPVSLLTDFPVAVAVRTASPVRDLRDLLDRARAAPGRLTYGSGGVGSAVHLASALLASMAGVEMLHVPYGGAAQGITALYAGEIDVLLSSTVDFLPLARQGSVRLIGITSPGRLAAAPEIQPVNEVVPGYTMLQWVALFAPRGTPPALVERLAGELAQLREDPELQGRLAAGAATIRFDGPAPLAERLASDLATWRTVIARENIRAE